DGSNYQGLPATNNEPASVLRLTSERSVPSSCAGGGCIYPDSTTHILSFVNSAGTAYQMMGTGNCTSSAAPAVCAAAAQGSVVVAAAATTVTVNTTAVTANSQILLTFDSSL